MKRRTFVLGLGAVATAFPASAQTRMAVPGGGFVIVPSPFDKKPRYPTYSDRAGADVLIGYRNWRSTMSGYPECDGMLGVAHSSKFRDLADFVMSCEAGLSVHWSDADRIPGQPWDGNEKRFERVLSADGAEMTQQLAVHRSGFFDVYDEPARLFAVRHGSGLSIAIWLYDKHGGLKEARKAALRIAASFQP